MDLHALRSGRSATARATLVTLFAAVLAGCSSTPSVPNPSASPTGSVREQLATQLPAQLATQLDQRLAEYSITPTTISNLARMIDLFGRAGAAVPAGAAAATTGAAARTGTSGIGQVPVRMLMENDRMMRGAVPLSSLGPNGRAMGPGFSAHRTIARIL